VPGTRLLLFGFLATSLQAQVRVTVVTPDSQPVTGAVVELWSSNSRTASAVTNGLGQTAFSRDLAERSLALLVRRIGFSPTRHEIGLTDGDVRVVLTPLAASLPAVSIDAARRSCPHAESVEGRSLWDSARKLYNDTSTSTRASELEHYSGDISPDSLGVIDASNLTDGLRGTNSVALRGYRQDIDREGYVWALRGKHHSWDYGIWRYPLLEADYAQHFAEPRFGKYHTFTVLSDLSGERAIQFCPRDRSRTGLEGVLRLDARGSFVSARWTFWNPKRDAELAGGEVAFVPRDQEADHPVLLAAYGLFWRKLPTGRYYQRWQRYNRWVVALPGDPTRKE
jgi:hypothetical protein